MLRQKSNPALVNAIVESFSASPEPAGRKLVAFSSADWRRVEFWLDTSGLALYFLDHARKAGFSHVIDASTYERLETKRRQNSRRVEAMTEEFLVINQDLLTAGVRFANLKGFTNFPHACPDITLRNQSDYDLLVDPADIDAARRVVERLGYSLKAATPRTLEFQAAPPARVRLEDQYTAGLRRAVELHTAIEGIDAPSSSRGTDVRLSRLQLWDGPGQRLPALCAVDQLVAQARHLLQHLRDDHTRPSWVLEYRNHVIFRRNDKAFLRDLRSQIEGDAETVLSLGLATVLAEDLFGPFASADFKSWTVDMLEPRVRLWADMYGRRAVLADVPGTKLCLLLDEALQDTHPAVLLRNKMRLFIPRGFPSRVQSRPVQETLGERARRWWAQWRYVSYRSRFHFGQSLFYLLELPRWRYALRSLRPAQTTACDGRGSEWEKRADIGSTIIKPRGATR